MKLFDSSKPRAIADFRDYAAERAISFARPDDVDANAERLAVLESLLKEKRFAYVGESDHFIHEKYAYRRLMLDYLASRGFTFVGEELSASDGRRIDRFIENGDASQLERIATYGYAGAIRKDRDDKPTGILRASFGDAYPTALFAAEQKRFAHGLREISLRLKSSNNGRLHFFGFDIDALPGCAYEDVAEVLEAALADAAIDRIRSALALVPGETIEDEIARLDAVVKQIDVEAERFTQILGAEKLLAMRHAATCLRDSFDYVRITYPSKTWDALNPGMAYRERFMHRQVDRVLGQMRPNEKMTLMSHNMHLCRAPEAVAASGASAGPGGKTDPPLGAWLAARYPAQVFSIWMLIGRGGDSQPFPTLSRTIAEKAGTLNAILGEIGGCFLLPIDASDSRARLLTETVDVMHDGNLAARIAIAPQADALFFVRDVTPLRL